MVLPAAPSKFPGGTGRVPLYNWKIMSFPGGSMNRATLSTLFAAAFLFAGAGAASAMSADGCGSGSCTDCHSLSREEAVKMIGANVDNVLSVGMSPVKGLWEVAVEKGGKRWPVYVDFSKGYIVAGQIVQVSTGKNLTGSRMLSMNRIDVSQVPTEGSIVIGKKDAKYRIVVFDDPNCTHCAKLHETAKGIVAKNPDIAFFIRPFPRNNDRPTYEKALSIVCAGTVQALEDGFAGKTLPAGKCDGKALDDTIQAAKRFNIRTTPTMVLPDGRVVAGAIEADAI